MDISKLGKKILKAGNNRELLVNISGAFFIKGFALFVALLTMPAFMNYFQNQQVLGVWFTLLSMLTWILMFDLGIGNGLRNHLVTAFVENNQVKVKQLISSAYIILGFLSFFILLFGIFFIYNSNWNNILNINNSVISNMVLRKAILYSFMGLIIHFFLKIVLSILNAMQKTALPNLIMFFPNVLILFYILFFDTQSDAQNLLNVSLTYILAINIPVLISTIILFSGKLKYARPSVKYYVHNTAKMILKLGGKFFWIQITFMVITSSNEIIITNLYGPELVVEYQIYNRLFYMFIMMFSLVSNPMWSAISKAHAEKNMIRIKKAQKILTLMAIISSLACFLIIPFLQPIINIWLGAKAIQINHTSAFVFAVFSSIMMFIISISSVANGIGQLKSQLFGNSVAALLKIPLCYFISLFFHSWITIIIINIIILAPYALLQPIFINKYLKQSSIA